tara:strand:+ start:102 stop:296 length:195 start_codon:yes stop_codon:yes gene_type:complete
MNAMILRSSVKVGDLVRIKKTGETAVITQFVSFEKGENQQPVIMIEGRLQLYGESMLEVISETG